MRVLILWLFSLLLTSMYSHEIPLFSPPPGWQQAVRSEKVPYMQVGFVGKGSTFFQPSISLATEEVQVSHKEYVKAVKTLHMKRPNTTWRDLGKFTMQAGVGTLTEITSPSPCGKVKILQAILVKEKTAYILTAATIQEDFAAMQKEILASLQSFSLHANLADALPSQAKKSHFQQLLASLTPVEKDLQPSRLEQWQKEMVQEFPEMGGHWHFLALQEGFAKICGGE